MRQRVVRAALATATVLLVLLIPACELEGGRVKVTGPSIGPEISAAIGLAAELF